MTAIRKTDNHDPSAKLALRRYFLDRYHRNGTATVCDCCQGSGFLWRELRREYKVAEYVGFDVKPRKGRLRIDSSRYLEAGGWKHNCIDVDTYGAPWRHWKAILKFAQNDLTVFLTIGLVRIGGAGGMQQEALAALGVPKQTPPGIIGALHDMAAQRLLGEALERFEIVEAIEAISNGSARYMGLRLSPRKDLDVKAST